MRYIIICLVAASLFMASTAQAKSFAQYLAPVNKCGAPSVDTSKQTQLDSMYCYVNYARSHIGKHSLKTNRKLQRAAMRKAIDLHRCSFDHTACGRAFTYWPRHYGYRYMYLGENIAWGTIGLGDVRHIFNAWLHSKYHRKNILYPAFREQGVGFSESKTNGVRTLYWANEFGAQ